MKTIEIIGENYFGSYHNTRTACRAIIIKDGMVLLSYQKFIDVYMFPGGGLEENETEEECARREVEEETGFIVGPLNNVLEIDEYYEDTKFVTIFFAGNILKRGTQNLTPNEIKEGMEPRWMKLDDVIKTFSTHETYRDKCEIKRGIYLREYNALKSFLG